MECFSGVKTAQNSKTEGGIEREKKHENVKLKEDDVPGAVFTPKQLVRLVKVAARLVPPKQSHK